MSERSTGIVMVVLGVILFGGAMLFGMPNTFLNIVRYVVGITGFVIGWTGIDRIRNSAKT